MAGYRVCGCPLTQEPFDAVLGIVTLPSLDGWPTHLEQAPDFEHGQAVSVWRMISARWMCLSGRLRSPMIAAERARSWGETVKDTVWTMTEDSHDPANL